MPNVKLSEAELALACNTNILLTKNSIIQKVYELFGQLSGSYIDIIKADSAFKRFASPSPKISKGENYMGLPWVMLDYPRIFSGDDILSVRTMFWWGNYFSQFVILKGAYLPDSASIPIIKGIEHFYICTSTDPWQHHFGADNMTHVSNLTGNLIKDQVYRSGFLKLGTKIPIERWESVENFMSLNFMALMNMALANEYLKSKNI